MAGEINSVISNLVTLLKNMEAPVSAAGLRFSTGQVIEALVVSREGDNFLLKCGDKSFLAQAETPLQEGETVRLVVLGSENETVLLKKVPFLFQDADEPLNESERVKHLLHKYGISSEKDIISAEKILSRLPCDESTAVRLLCDHHLLVALFLPDTIRADDYQRIEINEYKSHNSRKNIWEVCLDLDLSALGHLDIEMRMVEETIYTRIWAESKDIEEILNINKDELKKICSNIEIISSLSGPLFSKEPHKNIDLKA